MFIKRKISARLKELFKSYPVLTLTGPRQSGKTTLVKETFKNYPYVNLEKVSDREFAESDPENFLAQYPDGAIIDEVQRVPELLSSIQAFVDEDGRDSLFVLTGSHNPSLIKNVSQSLAGRTSLSVLLPFSISELTRSNLNLNSILFGGLYPRVNVKKINPSDYYSDYLETYLGRDVADIIQVKNKSLFIKFMKLAAGRIGQPLNKDDLARDVGISPATCEEWISVLEATYIVYRLQPWFKNINKRVIKSPKLYFFDVGLASHLIGINEISQISTHPLKGNLFENLQVVEALKWQYNLGKKIDINYLRDSKGKEIDLIIQNSDDLLPIEIKSAARFDSSFLKGFSILDSLNIDLKLGKHILTGMNKNQKRSNCTVWSWRDISKLLSEKL